MFVNTADVAALADKIDNQNNRIADTASEVTEAMNRLNNSWSGAAGERVISLFNSINTNCIEAQRQIVGEYAKFLRLRISAGYEQVETANKSLSEAFK